MFGSFFMPFGTRVLSTNEDLQFRFATPFRDIGLYLLNFSACNFDFPLHKYIIVDFGFCRTSDISRSHFHNGAVPLSCQYEFTNTWIAFGFASTSVGGCKDLLSIFNCLLLPPVENAALKTLFECIHLIWQ